jgi:hypothetical protein
MAHIETVNLSTINLEELAYKLYNQIHRETSDELRTNYKKIICFASEFDFSLVIKW